MAKADSGLQLSMRLLLGIIAGLLISDLLKATVNHFRSCGSVYIWNCPDALIAAAAAIFLFRVVTDNMLYYADPDPLSSSDAYATRVLLIVLDLVSYAFCYDIVSRLDPTSGPIAEAMAYGIFGDMAIVELLHLIWCYVALDRVRLAARRHRSEHGESISAEPCSDCEDNVRLIKLLWSWRFLSATFTLIWGLVWLHLLSTNGWPNTGKALLLFVLSGCSAVAYTVVMREQYLAARAQGT